MRCHCGSISAALSAFKKYVLFLEKMAAQGSDKTVYSPEWFREVAQSDEMQAFDEEAHLPRHQFENNFGINDVIKSFALVEFKLYGVTYNGSIHIAEFGKAGYGYIKWLPSVIHDGDKFDVILDRYDEKYSRWTLRLNTAKVGNPFSD